MSIAAAALFVAGLVLLLVGADALVRGAATVASRIGVSPVVVGLTIVAFGTSLPELAITVGSGRSDDAALGLGNVVGSNIANVLLVLGIGAAVGGLAVSQRLLIREIPVMLGASVGVWVLAADGQIGTGDAVVLVGSLAGFVAWTVGSARRERPEVLEEYEAGVERREGAVARRRGVVLAVQIGVGLVALALGAELLVDAATTIATDLGVSDLVIGLTVVAIGTSLPEVASTVLAVVRRQPDIAVANAVGSNLFNLLAVLGVAVLVSGPIPVSDAVRQVDLPVMIAAAVVLVPVAWKRFVIGRWEGGALVACYVAYVTYLVLDTRGHAHARYVGGVALAVGGLVALVAVAVGTRTRRAARRSRSNPPGVAVDDD